MISKEEKDNLADKAKRLGIPLFDFRGGGG